MSQPTSLGEHRRESVPNKQKKKRFFKLVVEGCKFGVGPHSCVEYDCRCRRKPETRCSWFSSQILGRFWPRITTELNGKHRRQREEYIRVIFCACFVFHNWNVPNNPEARIIWFSDQILVRSFFRITMKVGVYWMYCQ